MAHHRIAALLARLSPLRLAVLTALYLVLAALLAVLPASAGAPPPIAPDAVGTAPSVAPFHLLIAGLALFMVGGLSGWARRRSRSRRPGCDGTAGFRP